MNTPRMVRARVRGARVGALIQDGYTASEVLDIVEAALPRMLALTSPERPLAERLVVAKCGLVLLEELIKTRPQDADALVPLQQLIRELEAEVTDERGE